MSKIAEELACATVEESLTELIGQQQATRLDDQFYAQFNDIIYQGQPLGQYLRTANLGNCLDCSKLLAEALQQKNAYNVQLCRGVLRRLNAAFKKEFLHGWVEQGNQVIDTTWQVAVDRDAYYDLFDVAVKTMTPLEHKEPEHERV